MKPSWGSLVVGILLGWLVFGGLFSKLFSKVGA